MEDLDKPSFTGDDWDLDDNFDDELYGDELYGDEPYGDESRQTPEPHLSQIPGTYEFWNGHLPDADDEFVGNSFTEDPIFDIPDEEDDYDTEGDDDDILNTASKGPSLSTGTIKLPQSSCVSLDIPESTLLIPRSCYEPFEPGFPVVSEREAMKLLRQSSESHIADFIEFELNDFAVYFEDAKFPTEMRSFGDLGTKMGHNQFLFNGVLSAGDTKVFVHGVPIAALPIGNYGSLTEHSVGDQIWIQSLLNADRDIYYKVGRPAKEYARFHRPFLWVADLAKHFVDFLKVMGEDKRKVTIHSFRRKFSAWLKKMHKHAPEFVSWLAEHPSADFRTSIVANLAFLHKEAIGVLGNRDTYYHALWAEIWEFDRYKGVPPLVNVANPPTVVTQYIYDCFEHLPFGDRLEPLPISKTTERLRNKLIQQRQLELPSQLQESPKQLSTASQQRIQSVKAGDTISTHRDEDDTGTAWKREVSKGDDDVDRWFALVQKVHVNTDGTRSFDVLWYYRPVDTLCGVMKYPWRNELFLSDHCSCADRAKIDDDEVLGVHDVEFGGGSKTTAEFFCRLTYTHEERRWVSLRGEHRRCKHERLPSKVPEYIPGDTLLVRLDLNSVFSEPCELVSFFLDRGTTTYCFRKLLRRKQVDRNAATAPRNELIYSDDMIQVKESRILGSCHVRFFKHDQAIPTPYDRNGVGNCFFITHQELIEDNVKQYTPLDSFPSTLRQGLDPDLKTPKLRGFDLFCGGGNFGRGLEDGGGIEMHWANDYDSQAMHTYMANTKPRTVSPFLGSIDDLQRLAIEGKFADNVPCIGDVDFISGGSPCPGFSLLTNDKTTLRQRKNQSLVAAFGSFIDLYRPKYGLLENVTGIVQKKANKDQDVFSQLICAIVGLGYQTQFFFLDASQFGSPQRRSRVFLAFAAPGHALPRKPPQTHSHPPNTKRMRLGCLPNGMAMAERDIPDTTPFKFVSALEATADLPPVGDSKPNICVPFPDHRVSVGQTKLLQSKIRLIPTRPWGSNFATAWFGADRKRAGSGVLSAADRAAFPPDDGGTTMSNVRVGSNAYGRQFPHRPLETVVTRQTASDAKQGRQLHWREPRVMTIMEARRAQGFRDDDVLLGKPAVQYKIVGNSVAREVAVALGVVFREAWVESLRAQGDNLPGSEALPLVIEDDVTSDSGGYVSTGGTPDMQPQRSRCPTPSTALSSPARTPARGSVGPINANRKRPLQSTLSIEIFTSKLLERKGYKRIRTESEV